MVKPVLVLSGHDHDQCTVRHRASFISVLEHTLGSFSWQAGNHYPSFMLLSVASSTSKQSVEGRVVSSQLCFLPYQTFIYIWYAILFVVSVLLLFGLPLPSPNWKQYSTSIRQFVIHVVSSRPNGEVKEKEEDVDCEYEMVWDAEGAMHLIKKCSSHTLVSKPHGNQVSTQGTVMARPSVKRQLALDALDVSASAELTKKVESNSFLSQPKIKVNGITRKLKQGVGPLAVLVVVNVGLYVMLLMKDWTNV
eukprot:c19032_g1_i2 orf=1048-1797(+)